MICSLCNKQKARRFCPALHQEICPACCGREREVTLDCPSQCGYLQQARQHQRRSLEQVAPELLFPGVEIRRQLLYEREPLLAGLSYALAEAARTDRSLRDPDLLATLSALARKLETLSRSGLHLPAENISPAQQALGAELERLVAEYRQMEQQHAGFTGLKDSELLALVVFLLRTGYGHTSGRPRSRAFLDFLEEQFPPKAGAPGGNRLVTP